jgi:hypothetical protein
VRSSTIRKGSHTTLQVWGEKRTPGRRGARRQQTGDPMRGSL